MEIAQYEQRNNDENSCFHDVFPKKRHHFVLFIVVIHLHASFSPLMHESVHTFVLRNKECNERDMKINRGSDNETKV